MTGFNTTASKEKGVYTKFFNRPLSLIGAYFWEAGERVEIPKICGGEVFFEPLLIYRPEKGVSVYYNESDPNQDPERFVGYFNQRPLEFSELVRSYTERFAKLSQMIEEDQTDIATFAELLRDAWPAFVLASILANECREKTDAELLPQIDELRVESDRLLPIANAYVFNLASSQLPQTHREDAYFITFEEVLSGAYPSEAEKALRRGGYVYFRGKLSAGNVTEYLVAHGITLEEGLRKSSATSIKGTPAWRGHAKGRAKLIFEASQIGKVEEGDILVTPMTSPDFLPAMLKAAAFVTDEGGITCHAAIVAREMKKPCIVGTKVATKTLKDGDLLEVDAERGIITKL